MNVYGDIWYQRYELNDRLMKNEPTIVLLITERTISAWFCFWYAAIDCCDSESAIYYQWSVEFFKLYKLWTWMIWWMDVWLWSSEKWTKWKQSCMYQSDWQDVCSRAFLEWRQQLFCMTSSIFFHHFHSLFPPFESQFGYVNGFVTVWQQRWWWIK